MKLTKLYFIPLLIITVSSFAQEQDEVDVTDVFKVTVINPGVSYEKRVGKYQTLYGQLFVNTSVSAGWSSSFGNSFELYVDPAFTAQYRYYYNAKKRERKGKRTDLNSMNYLTGIFETLLSKRTVSASSFNEPNRRSINTLGVAWGFQRNYNSRFSLDLNLGLGYLVTKVSYPNIYQASDVVGEFTTMGQINIGFWLNRRM